MTYKETTFVKATKKLTTKPEVATFWHATTDSRALKSFLNDGAKAIGKGLGGQSGGFFAWNSHDKAYSHLTKFLFNKKDSGEGLLVGTNVDIKQISYPIWQFDLENCYILNPLLIKYKDEIINVKNLTYTTKQGKSKTVDFLRTGRYFDTDFCSFRIEEKNNCFERTVFFTENDTEDLDLYQALIDKMCKHKDFRQDYNKILIESVLDTNGTKLLNFLQEAGYTHFNDIGYGFKYCGKKPLNIDEVFYIKKNGQNIFKETQLYTSSECKEKQICPFLKMYISNQQKS